MPIPSARAQNHERRHTVGDTVIERLRSRKNITQVELARVAGVTRESVCYWETGQYPIGADGAAKVARALGADADELRQDQHGHHAARLRQAIKDSPAVATKAAADTQVWQLAASMLELAENEDLSDDIRAAAVRFGKALVGSANKAAPAGVSPDPLGRSPASRAISRALAGQDKGPSQSTTFNTSDGRTFEELPSGRTREVKPTESAQKYEDPTTFKTQDGRTFRIDHLGRSVEVRP
jgi:transcriptional regulator with XRE-family HTH domain